LFPDIKKVVSEPCRVDVPGMWDDTKGLKIIGSVEIPDLTSLPEIHGEPVFHGYHKGGYLSCQMAGQIRENVQKTVFDVPKEHVKIIIRLFF
jgi:hypothetical protein